MRVYDIRLTVLPLIEVIVYAAVLVHVLTYFRVDQWIESIYPTKSVGHTALFAFVRAGLLEEIVKMLVLVRHIASRDVQNLAELLTVGVCAGAGFAAFENIHFLAAAGAPIASQLPLMFLRVGTVTPLHISCTLTCAALCGEGMMSKSRAKTIAWTVLALLLPVVIHGLYDFAILSGDWPLKSTVVGSVFAMYHTLIAAFMYTTACTAGACDQASAAPIEADEQSIV
jgi:RsiW-degrading membrane proteinase PrsW (M82 family)